MKKEDALKKILMQRMRELRVERKLSQDKVAEELGVSRSTYTYYETGKTTPSVYTLLKLAEWYGVSVLSFLGQDEQKSEG